MKRTTVRDRNSVRHRRGGLVEVTHIRHRSEDICLSCRRFHPRLKGVFQRDPGKRAKLRPVVWSTPLE